MRLVSLHFALCTVAKQVDSQLLAGYLNNSMVRPFSKIKKILCFRWTNRSKDSDVHPGTLWHLGSKYGELKNIISDGAPHTVHILYTGLLKRKA